MNEQFQQRVCATCKKVLPVKDEVQSGWYCCDEYYCSQPCLDKSFVGIGQTWQEHYDEQNDEFTGGDCYWTEWEYDPDVAEAIG